MKTVENQVWTYPPFASRLEDGDIWDRGAIDMKGCLSMMLLAVLQEAIEQTSLPGDMILAAVRDEETGSNFWARFHGEENHSYFQDVRFTMGEFGGFSYQNGN